MARNGVEASPPGQQPGHRGADLGGDNRQQAHQQQSQECQHVGKLGAHESAVVGHHVKVRGPFRLDSLADVSDPADSGPKSGEDGDDERPDRSADLHRILNNAANLFLVILLSGQTHDRIHHLIEQVRAQPTQNQSQHGKGECDDRDDRQHREIGDGCGEMVAETSGESGVGSQQMGDTGPLHDGGNRVLHRGLLILNHCMENAPGARSTSIRIRNDGDDFPSIHRQFRKRAWQFFWQ